MLIQLLAFYVFFFFNDTATTEIYTLSLHDALPIWTDAPALVAAAAALEPRPLGGPHRPLLQRQEPRPLHRREERSEEHTSELQSRQYLVCRLLLEKKKKNKRKNKYNKDR